MRVSSIQRVGRDRNLDKFGRVFRDLPQTLHKVSQNDLFASLGVEKCSNAIHVGYKSRSISVVSGIHQISLWPPDAPRVGPGAQMDTTGDPKATISYYFLQLFLGPSFHVVCLD